jgi:hypothetical protein
MRMRQSIAQLERAFEENFEQEAAEHEELLVEVDQRRFERHRERTHKHGSARFALLLLILVGTAVLVTLAMFQTLYYVMG